MLAWSMTQKILETMTAKQLEFSEESPHVFLGKVFYNIPYVSLLLGSTIKKKNAMLNFLTLTSLGQYGVS